MMTTAAGESISAGPYELRLEVRIGASGIPAERLEAIIGESQRCSPISAALVNAVPIALHVEIDPG